MHTLNVHMWTGTYTHSLVNIAIFTQEKGSAFLFLFSSADIWKPSFPDQFDFLMYFVLLNGFPRRKVGDSECLPNSTDKIFCLIRH